MIIAVLVLAVALIYLVIKKYLFQILMLSLSIAPFIAWNFLAKETKAYVPIFAMEDTFLAIVSGNKFNSWMYGSDILPKDAESMLVIFITINVLIIVSCKVSKWSVAAGIGYVATIAVPCFMGIINILAGNNPISGAVVFIITLITMIVSMWIGFHTFTTWILPTSDVLSLVAGIVPALVINFIAFCNLFTMSFGTVVIDKYRYVVIAIILTVLLYGIGIFLYFSFKEKYLMILNNKIQKECEKRGIE